MRNSISRLLDAAQKRMSGYVALAHYRFLNLVVKARPEVLLSFQLEDDPDKSPIEEVAHVCNADGRDDQFEIYPLDSSQLFTIVKSLKKAHPEFKVEVVSVDDSEEEEDKYILATMPFVDQNRHDVLMEGVSIINDWCDGQLKAAYGACLAEITPRLADAPADELDEAKDVLKAMKDQHDDLLAQYKADKEAEIEDALKRYQEEQAQNETVQQENDAAHNVQAGMQMKWPPEDE